MEKKLIVLPKEVEALTKSVTDEKRNEVLAVLNHVFNGVSKMREQLDVIVVKDENDNVNMKLANTIRLGVRQVRLDAEKKFDAKRAEVQSAMLSYKTEDSLWLKSKQTMQILTKEIEDIARYKEETRRRAEAEKRELLIHERILSVQKFNPEIERSEFEYMSEETFSTFLNGIEKAFNDKVAAERKAEEERIAKEKAEAEERARIKAENERLKLEAEKKEKQLAQERAKAEAERKELETKAAKEKAEADLKLKAEKEANEKLQAEIKAKEEADEKAKIDAERKENEDREAKKKADAIAAKAPIKQKLKNWIDELVFEIPNGLDNDKTAIIIIEKFKSFKIWAKKEIEK